MLVTAVCVEHSLSILYLLSHSIFIASLLGRWKTIGGLVRDLAIKRQGCYFFNYFSWSIVAL